MDPNNPQDQIAALKDMYPAFGPDIDLAASNGHAADAIRASIGQKLEEYKQRGASPQQLYQTFSDPTARAAAEAPTTGEWLARTGSAAINRATLGWAGKPLTEDINPYQGTGSLIAQHFLSAGAGDLPLMMGAGKVLGPLGAMAARTLGPEAAPALQGVVRGLAEGAGFSGVDVAGSALRGEETPGSAAAKVALGTLTGGLIGGVGAHIQGLTAERARIKTQAETALQTAAQEKTYAAAKARFLAEVEQADIEHDRLTEAANTLPERQQQALEVPQAILPRPGQEYTRLSGEITPPSPLNEVALPPTGPGVPAPAGFEPTTYAAAQAQIPVGPWESPGQVDYHFPELQKSLAYEAMSHGPDGRLLEVRAAEGSPGPPEKPPLTMPSGLPAPTQPRRESITPPSAAGEQPITDTPTPEPRAYRLRRVPLGPEGTSHLEDIRTQGGELEQLIDSGADLTNFAREKGLDPQGPEIAGLQGQLLRFAQESKLSPDETVALYRTPTDPVRPGTPNTLKDPTAARAAQPIQTPTEVGFSPADVIALNQEATARNLKLVQQLKNPTDPNSPIIGYKIYAKDGATLYDGGKSVADLQDFLHQGNKLLDLRDGIPGGIIPGFEGTPGKPTSPAELAQRGQEMWRPEHPADAWRTLRTYLDYPATSLSPPPSAVGKMLEIMGAPTLADARANFSQAMKATNSQRLRNLLGDAFKARVRQDIAAPLKLVKDPNTGILTYLTCSSPCEPTPFPQGWQNASQDVQDRARVQLDFDINVQQQLAHEQQALFGNLTKAYGEGALGAEFRSISFITKSANTPYFTTTVQKAQLLARQGERFLESYARKTNAVMGDIQPGSDDAFALGQLMATPDLRNDPGVMGSISPKIKAAFEFVRDNLAHLAQLKGAGPEELLPDYFTHVFDRQTIVRSAQKFFELKAAGQLPPGMTPELMGRYEQSYRAVIEAMNNGEKIWYRQLPLELKDKYFEHRNGALGYSLDGAKAWNSYLNAYARQAYVDPMMEEFNTTLNRLKNDGKDSLASYFNGWVRDYAGLADPSSLSVSTQRFLNGFRKFEYVRAIGSFNPTTPLKHIGQQGFMAIQAGPKAWIQGQNLAWAARADAPEGSVGEYLYKMMGYDPTTNPGGKAVLEDKLFLGGREQVTQNQTVQKLLDAGSWMFNLMRQYTLKTGFTTGLSKWYGAEGRAAGLDLATDLANRTVPEEAMNAAVDFTGRTAFFYGKADMPMALRGPVGGTLLQFQSYHIKTLEMLNQLAHEGPKGLAQLAGILAVGAGVAKAGQLASIDTTSLGGTPLDMLSAVQTLKGASEGDWNAAKEHAVEGLTHTARALTTLGPATGMPGKMEALAQQIPGMVRGDVHAAQVARNLFERELLPVEVERGVQAYRNYMLTPGADPAGLIEELAGFPNAQVRTRLAIAQAYRDGHPQKAMDLRTAYVRLIGPLPLDMANVHSAASAAYAMKTIKDAQDRQTQITANPLAKLKRTLPENIRRMIP